MNRKHYLPILILLVALISCQSTTNKTVSTSEKPVKVYKHVEWSKNANIYEVNVRQYTPEGTFAAFEKHLSRLRDMGVDILWLMPINPISKKNRKGSLGSYYAVQDYQKVNPEFGNIDDLKHLVKSAHELGMHVIIDWVANHTGWDNWLIDTHPDWYTHDSIGNIISPVPDWTDVADLNYDKPELREYMIQSLEFWINNADVDGYRCDVAGSVPIDFWMEARKRLDAIKPVFMLGEVEDKKDLLAFDMIYGWEFHHIMNGIAQGTKTIADVDAYFQKVDTTYDVDDYFMYFTSNHDENSWNGSEYERMGDAADAMAVLSATIPGMPLIYSGQEDRMDKRLKFFDKDTIEWGSYANAGFYAKLLKLKHDNEALFNGAWGAPLQKISNDNPEKVYSFVRKKDNDEVLVIINFSAVEQNISITQSDVFGSYESLFNQTPVAINGDNKINLGPWGYKVLTRKE